MKSYFYYDQTYVENQPYKGPTDKNIKKSSFLELFLRRTYLCRGTERSKTYQIIFKNVYIVGLSNQLEKH